MLMENPIEPHPYKDNGINFIHAGAIHAIIIYILSFPPNETCCSAIYISKEKSEFTSTVSLFIWICQFYIIIIRDNLHKVNLLKMHKFFA